MKALRRALLAALLLSIVESPHAADHGVILLYHHVADDTPAATSVTVAQFAAHLDFIADQGFQVLALDELLDALLDGRAVPDNALAISFDDAYRSVYETAYPLLRKRGWPFTVFVASDPIDRGFSDFMTWTQLREMAGDGVAFGGHSRDHEHLVRRHLNESVDEWHQRVRANVRDNMRRLREQLPGVVDAFAYPYGEHSEALRAIIADEGLRGIAQQSGGVNARSNPQLIPRFPMMTSMASLERLSLALNVVPMPVQVVDAGDEIRSPGLPPGTLELALEYTHLSEAIQCFSASGKALAIERREQRLSIALPPMQSGRNKVNCTAATGARQGEYYWHAQQWLVQPRPVQ